MSSGNLFGILFVMLFPIFIKLDSSSSKFPLKKCILVAPGGNPGMGGLLIGILLLCFGFKNMLNKFSNSTGCFPHLSNKSILISVKVLELAPESFL